MSNAQAIRNFINTISKGKLFTYSDIPNENMNAVAIELSRLYKKGAIKKISKGKFYKPKKRTFGEVGPKADEKILSYIGANSKDVFYETGINSFRQLGLTTQVSGIRTIATNKPYRKIKIDNLEFNLVPMRANVKKDEIHLAQILDALKDIKKIPNSTPTKAIKQLKDTISKISKANQEKLTNYALEYPPRVRALLGLILEDIGNVYCANKLKRTINPLTTFTLNIDDNELTQKKHWNIK